MRILQKEVYNFMKLGIIGGDLRIVNLVEILTNQGHEVLTYGLEKADFKSKNIIKCEKLNEFLKDIQVFISSIPFTQDGKTIVASFTNKDLNILEILDSMKEKLLIAGAFSNEVKVLAKEKNIQIIDLLENEKLSILNSIPTAEGAIQIAMEKSNKTIHDSNCLILGFRKNR